MSTDESIAQLAVEAMRRSVWHRCMSVRATSKERQISERSDAEFYLRLLGVVAEFQSGRGATESTPTTPHNPRCHSCEHAMTWHRQEGCWFTVTSGKTDKDMVCACSVAHTIGKSE